LNKLPLTPNGKVDRKALPEPDISDQQSTYVAPRTQTEKILCEIWQELLGVERVGITDNFFQLGGHSLLATRLVAKVNRVFEINALLKTLFECENLCAMSEIVSEKVVLNKNNHLMEETKRNLEIEW
jgi:hypothetical protein